MDMHLLSATAILTLGLNVILTLYLLKDKMNIYSRNTNKKETINFVLTPYTQKEIAPDTEVLATEIISLGNNHNE